MNFEEGEVILIDKPLEWTSFDVIKKLKRELNIKKIGHAGTLDPLATGLLILCTGKKTKEISQYQQQEKEYVGSLVLGQTTPSIDKETPFDDIIYPTAHITDELIARTLLQFQGEILQSPPLFSAIKIKGKRAYTKARKGEIIEIEPRPVFIRLFEITSIQDTQLNFRVICSKGTYIRSLVRDFGKALGSGAYLSALERTRIGAFTLEMASDITTYIKKIRENEGI